MGQKVNPHGLRVGVIKDWDSKWIAGKKDFGDQLVEDYNIRKFVKKACYDAGVAKIGIERKQNKVFITIHAAKPGIIIGRGGAEIDKLKAQIEKLTSKTVNVNIMEVKTPDTNAQLVAENIAAQLERRISFRRAMKQVPKTVNKVEIKKAVEEAFGVKVAKVNTMNLDGKTRRRGRTAGKTAKTKKAIVKLTEDSKDIEIFEGL